MREYRQFSEAWSNQGKRPIKTYPLIASILYCIVASYSCSLIRADVEIILKDGQELLSIEYLQEVYHSAKDKKYYRKFIEPRIARIYSGFYACNLSHSWMCNLQSPQAPKLRRWRWGLLIDTPGQAVWGRDPECAEFVRRFCPFDLTTEFPYRFESKYSYHRRATGEFAAIFLLAMKGYEFGNTPGSKELSRAASSIVINGPKTRRPHPLTPLVGEVAT